MSETVLYKNDAVKKLKKRAKVRREIIGTLMIAAPLIGFIAFTLFPMVISFIVSFHDLHSYNMKYMEYCGWDNYKKIFAIGKFSDKDVIYVTNNEGILCFTMSEKGIELYHSTLVEGGARFETFNKGVKQFFKDGPENAFALYNLRSNEGGGAYRFAYDFEINPKDLSDVLKTATVDLKSGELYNLDASGTAVDNAYICGIPVTLTFTTVPAKYNYCVTVE